MFVICFFFLFSLFNGEGAVIVEGFGSRRSRRILVGRRSFFVGACRREEKGGGGEGRAKEREACLPISPWILTHFPL